jgi:signal peptidase II
VTKSKELFARQSWLFFFAVVVVAADQLIKNLLIEQLTPGVPVPFLGEIIRLNLAYNDGAAFSIGAGATWIFTIISSAAFIYLIIFSFKIETTSWSIMAGVFLGGISGNLIDRLFREPGFAVGHVVDYIQIPFNFPIFNLADSAIFCICSLAVIRIMRGHEIGRKTVLS